MIFRNAAARQLEWQAYYAQMYLLQQQQQQQQQLQQQQLPSQSTTASVDSIVNQVVDKVSALLPNLVTSLAERLGQSSAKDSSSLAPPSKRRRLGREDEVTSETEEQEEGFVEPPAEDQEASTYRNRLKWIKDLLGMDSSDIVEVESGSMSMAPTQKWAKLSLPPSVQFGSKFESYTDSIKGKKKSTAKGKAGVYAPGSYPTVKVPKMDYYHIEDCPWPTQALPVTELLGNKTTDTLFTKSTINVSLSEDLVMKMETNLRKSMSVLSYLDWFVWAGSEKGQSTRHLMIDSEDKEHGGAQLGVEDLNKTVDTLTESTELLFSAGTAISHLADIVADTIGFIVTLRRDQWMAQMDKIVPLSEKQRLRSCSTNATALFTTEDLEECRNRLSKEKTNEAQVKMIDVAASLSALVKNKPNSYNSSLKPPGQANLKGLNFRSKPNKAPSNRGARGGRGAFGRGRGTWRGRGGSHTNPTKDAKPDAQKD